MKSGKALRLSVFFIFSSFIFLFGNLPAEAVPAVAEEARSRRLRIFSATADLFGFESSPEHPYIWSIVMETGHPLLLTTFVAALGGNANIYLGNGRKITGTGTNPEVLAATERLFEQAEKLRDLFEPTPKEILYPYDGEVRFYLFTFSSGILLATAEEVDMKDGDHPLSPIYLAAQDVITKMRGVVEGNQGVVE